ncbi:MAG: hypothetical protein AB1918_17710 [Pseudomonadota bacterium]
MSALAIPATGSELPQAPVETIRTVLRRDVADVLRAHLPVLAMVPRDKIYDRVMDDPALLHQAFKLFRAQPELFKAFLMTRERQLPESDGDALWCGRSLAEIVALVVRACARRYFHRRLPAPRRVVKPPAPGFWKGVAISLGLVSPAPTRRQRKPGASPGEKLFLAMRDLLLYEWQVPLIPAYAALEPQTVVALGPRLLELRESDRLHVLADPMAAAQFAQGKTPLLLDKADRLMVNDGAGINAEVLWTLSQKMHIGFLFPEWDTNELRRAVSMVSATAPQALATLVPAFGHDVRAFALFLFSAYGRMGNVRYKQVFGPEGQPWVVRALAETARRTPPTAPSLDQMKLCMERLIDGMSVDGMVSG